jgi:hypothetical protein
MRKVCYLLLLNCLVAASACKKTSSGTSGIASLNIINASVDLPSVVVNFSDTALPFYLNQAPISSNSSMEFGVPAGANPLIVVSSADTVKPVYRGTLDVQAGGIYSLYLAGQGGVADTVFTKDEIPVYADSSVGVRFINLSPDSKPISVNLAANDPTQTEFSNLTYKQIVGFKTYSANSNIGGSYNFEIRDQASGSLLTTFSWSYTLSKNNTLVINGSENDSSIAVFQVNNF